MGNSKNYNSLKIGSDKQCKNFHILESRSNNEIRERSFYTDSSCMERCRLCMEESNETRNIDMKFDVSSTLTLCQVIRECTDVDITPNDDLPQQLCKKCENELRIAFDFTKRLQKSISVYHNQLNIVPKIENNLSFSIENIKLENSNSEFEQQKIDPCTVAARIKSEPPLDLPESDISFVENTEDDVHSISDAFSDADNSFEDEVSTPTTTPTTTPSKRRRNRAMTKLDLDPNIIEEFGIVEETAPRNLGVQKRICKT